MNVLLSKTSKGIIHRDIKPANLLLGVDGTVKILDMGLASFRPEENEAVSGTVDFLAPEQTREKRRADQRSDIYSLGCTFFFLLTGKLLYEGKTVIQKVLAHREQPIPSLNFLDGVFQKMVATEPDARYQSMTEVIEALQGKKKKKKSYTVWILTVLLLVGVFSLALYLRGGLFRKEPPNEHPDTKQLTASNKHGDPPQPFDFERQDDGH